MTLIAATKRQRGQKRAGRDHIAQKPSQPLAARLSNSRNLILAPDTRPGRDALEVS